MKWNAVSSKFCLASSICIVRAWRIGILSPKTSSSITKAISRCGFNYVSFSEDVNFLSKIGDYGASTVYRLPWEATVHMSTGLCGSEPYIAPEQFLGKR